jgi:hypothetical protein
MAWLVFFLGSFLGVLWWWSSVVFEGAVWSVGVFFLVGAM